MHVEKNVCDSLIGTLLNIQGKTKDGVNAHSNLVEMKIREDLAPREVGRRTYLPPACYTMSKQEKISFCLCLKSVNVHQGYSSNIQFSVYARLEACWPKVSRLPHLNATIVTCSYSWNFTQKC